MGISGKTLSFDASEVIIRTRAANYLTVEVETDYLDEVLNEFNTDEIIQNYGYIDKLYEALKEHFGDSD